MLLFGHLGITLGTAVLLDAAYSKRCTLSTQSPQHTQQTKPSLLSRIDLRILLIGSLLPDIIDKPVGDIFFLNTFSNGRIFSHTLLFLLLITLAGFYLYHNHKKTWLLVLSFGTFMHLVLDQMWLYSHTILWPLYGFAFEKKDQTHVWEDMLRGLYTKPAVYIPEMIGAGIIGWFLLTLVRREKVYAFIRHGRII